MLRQGSSTARIALSLVAGTLGLCATASVANASASSDAATARSINLKGSDLPKAAKWSTSTVAATPAALGKKAVTCIRKAGGTASKASDDLFGMVGRPGGAVRADVTSPMFGMKGSFTGLPGANSETVVASSTSQALKDLAAIGAKTARSCLASLYAQVTAAQSGGGKVKASASAEPLQRFGAGSGGVHDRFVVSGGNVPGKLYLDLYFYVVRRVEVSVTFTGLGTVFPTKWATSTVANVMKRAKSLAK